MWVISEGWKNRNKGGGGKIWLRDLTCYMYLERQRGGGDKKEQTTHESGQK